MLYGMVGYGIINYEYFVKGNEKYDLEKTGIIGFGYCDNCGFYTYGVFTAFFVNAGSEC